MTNGRPRDPAGFLVPELPCPDCGHRRILGYRMDNEHGHHMHTHYVCTFWGSGMRRPCGWHGWSVPGWDDADDAQILDGITK
jgi:hypothetical protein